MNMRDAAFTEYSIFEQGKQAFLHNNANESDPMFPSNKDGSSKKSHICFDICKRK